MLNVHTHTHRQTQTRSHLHSHVQTETEWPSDKRDPLSFPFKDKKQAKMFKNIPHILKRGGRGK